jgi:hypothetical protein
MNSDHRSLFVDFDLPLFLGSKPPTLCRPDLRFVSTDSASISTFINKMHSHMDENRVFHSFEEFILDADVDTKPWRAANKLDTHVGHAFACGEAACATPPRPPWFVKLHKASTKVRFWKTALTQRNTGIDQTDVLNDIAGIVWTPDSIPAIPSNTKVLINVGRVAEKALRRIRRNAITAQKAEAQARQEKVALRISPKDTDAEVAIRNLDRRHANNRMYRRIRASLKPNASAPLTKVELISETDHVHPTTGKKVTLRKILTVDTKRELEAATIARNKTHFAQATDTPWTQSPLKHIGSHNGFNVFQNDDGNDIVLPESAFLETQTDLAILRERLDDPTPKWSPDISFDKFISALLHWRESTSTSPSGRHLGLYKALITAYIDASGGFSELDFDPHDGSTTGSPNDTGHLDTYADDSPLHTDPILTVQEQAEKILRIIYGLASTASRLGFYLQRWTQVVNVMIYKKTGVIELGKLRVIHLFEADFNLLVGVFFGRRATHHQADHQLIHPGQFGRPGGEYLESLPAWERMLLSNVRIPDKALLLQCLRTATHL